MSSYLSITQGSLMGPILFKLYVNEQCYIMFLELHYVCLCSLFLLLLQTLEQYTLYIKIICYIEYIHQKKSV